MITRDQATQAHAHIVAFVSIRDALDLAITLTPEQDAAWDAVAEYTDNDPAPTASNVAVTAAVEGIVAAHLDMLTAIVAGDAA